MRERLTVFVFVCSAFVFGCFAPEATEIEAREDRADASAEYHFLSWTNLEALVESAAVQLEASGPHAEQSEALGDLGYPYRCEEFEVHVREDGRLVHKRKRKTWTGADKKRFRKLVEMVADEMDADPRLLALWALRESTFRPDAIHVLNPDLEASQRAWSRHRYDAKEAMDLRARMKTLGAQDPEFWQARARLAQIERFKGNRFYDARVEFNVVMPDGSRVSDSSSRWAYGYGAFGFNPTYFLPTWDPNAPPWIFCDEDGVIAIVTAVWSAREALAECQAGGHGGRIVDVNRRFSRGHCEPSEHSDNRFRARARLARVDPDAPARLGKKWPRETTARTEIVAHMRRRATEEGLLPAR